MSKVFSVQNLVREKWIFELNCLFSSIYSFINDSYWSASRCKFSLRVGWLGSKWYTHCCFPPKPMIDCHIDYCWASVWFLLIDNVMPSTTSNWFQIPQKCSYQWKFAHWIIILDVSRLWKTTDLHNITVRISWWTVPNSWYWFFEWKNTELTFHVYIL